jgi:pilus assembly protein FimV
MIGIVLVLAAASAVHAMSIGRARGTAIVGRALDLSVQVALAPQDGLPESRCFAAEIFYGDNRVAPSAVQVAVERLVGSDLILSVRSSVAVDEPVVTVYLRATCPSAVSRRYVLLADAPTEQAGPVGLPQAAAPQPANSQTLQTSPLRTAPSAGAAAQASDPSSARTSREQRAAERRAAREQARLSRATEPAQAGQSPRAPATGSASAKRKADAPAVSPVMRSRLQVDLLDLAAIGEPQLRSSREMLSAPTADEGARAQAAALWRALNADPADALKDAQRVATIEAELRKLSASAQQQSSQIGVLKGQLEQAQRERYANPLVYALAGLLLLALLTAAWVWQRSRSAQASNSPWWQRDRSEQRLNLEGIDQSPGEFSDAQSNDRFPTADALSPAKSTAKPQPPAAQSMVTAQAGKGAAASGEAIIPSSWNDLVRQQDAYPSANANPKLAADFAQSQYSQARSTKAEELHDIQQQADFFMTLGQPDQAVEVLRNHIAEDIETSALAYIDLFDIFHKTGRRSDYDQLREEFNRVFNAEVPEFSDYASGSRGLEDYTAAISRIESLWPSPKVMEVIEESIFRKPDRDNEPFDVLAYRELLMLYALAKDINQIPQRAGEVALDFDVEGSESANDQPALTTLQALPTFAMASESFDPTRTTPIPTQESDDYGDLDDVMIPSSTPHGVDVDLGLFNDDDDTFPGATVKAQGAGPAAAPVAESDETSAPMLELDLEPSDQQPGKIIKSNQRR